MEDTEIVVKQWLRRGRPYSFIVRADRGLRRCDLVSAVSGSTLQRCERCWSLGSVP